MTVPAPRNDGDPTPDPGWATRLDPPKPGRVTDVHEVKYPDPIRFQAGEELAVVRRDDAFPRWIWCRATDGREGWVPDAIVELPAGARDRGVARHAYNARELPVSKGDAVRVIATFDGWHWVTEEGGVAGWVPESCVSVDEEPHEEQPMSEVTPKIDTVSYIILFVKDVEVSTAFYRDKVGVPVKFFDPHWTELATQGTTIALHKIDPANAGKTTDRPGNSEIVFQVKDVVGTREILQGRGIDIAAPKMVHEAGPDMVGASCVFRDPDGNLCSIYGMVPKSAVAGQ